MRKIKRRHRTAIHRFTEENRARWAQATRRHWIYILHQFYRWLEARELEPKHLTPEILEEFFCRPSGREITRESSFVYRNKVGPYLRWLHGNGGFRHNIERLVPRKWWLGPTPPTAEAFLRCPKSQRSKKTVENYRSDLLHFHQWLAKHEIKIAVADESQLLAFGDHLVGAGYSAAYRQKTDQRLRVYLYWLHERGVVRLRNPESCQKQQMLGSRLANSLPREALAFLEIVAVTRRPATVDNYRATCQHLHAFLDSRNKPLKDISRLDTEAWVKHLKSLGLGPSWRCSLLYRSKVYLWWLQENGIIGADPDQLLKSTDSPKRPKLLPKPLAPEDDARLQRTLEKQDHIYCRALLLMRWTGIRIGELVDLEYNCIWIDHAGHRYLKVPLGKLNNERMVPIDERTAALVAGLRELYHDDSKLRPRYLLGRPDGRQIEPQDLRAALHNTSREAGIKERVNSHRLRHTYATSLLNGGMSLVGVMRLLGHRSILMTLGYAAVSPESLRAEYLSAITNISERHRVDAAIEHIADEAPTLAATLGALSRLIRQAAHHRETDARKVRLLIKRVHRLQGEVEQLF